MFRLSMIGFENLFLHILFLTIIQRAVDFAPLNLLTFF